MTQSRMLLLLDVDLTENRNHKPNMQPRFDFKPATKSGKKLKASSRAAVMPKSLKLKSAGSCPLMDRNENSKSPLPVCSMYDSMIPIAAWIVPATHQDNKFSDRTHAWHGTVDLLDMNPSCMSEF